MCVVADTAAETESPDSNTEAGAPWQEPISILGRNEKIIIERGAARNGNARFLIDMDGIQAPQVDKQACRCRESCVAVSPAARDRCNTVLVAPLDAGDNVCFVGASRHCDGKDVSVTAIRRSAGRRITTVVRQHQRPVEPVSQVGEGTGFRRRDGGCLGKGLVQQVALKSDSKPKQRRSSTL